MKRNFILSIALGMLSSFLLYMPSAFAVATPGDDNEIPLDGGLSLLVAAGIAYGAKKAYDKRKKEKQSAHDPEETA
ncbi:MAG: hypothetical protein M9933_18535 [Chitinophagaceae bacterium]|nr:hypothetical protein [Chitinophagaceae bacterium]